MKLLEQLTKFLEIDDRFDKSDKSIKDLAQEIENLAVALGSLAKVVTTHHSMIQENAVANATIAKALTGNSQTSLPDIGKTKNRKPN